LLLLSWKFLEIFVGKNLKNIFFVLALDYDVFIKINFSKLHYEIERGDTVDFVGKLENVSQD